MNKGCESLTTNNFNANFITSCFVWPEMLATLQFERKLRKFFFLIKKKIGGQTCRIYYMTGIENNDKSNKTSKMLNVDRYRF